MRQEHFAGGVRQERREWDRIDAATVRFRRWNAADVLQEERVATPGEAAAFEQWEESQREDAIRNAAAQALDTNRTFLALASPTNAQNAAQVKALTRQNNALIRLVLRRLDAAE